MIPTELVRAAISAGCGTVADIARHSGLSRGTVELVMDHMGHTGELVRESLSSCPTSGCGSCSHNSGCSGSTGARGPVLLKLTRGG
ncbi:MarR family transcriptional regulator [Corynebacterium hindlerae]|uniref:MarR family transcriptional regulator n=1 Tax=Corynebacterium hindlerae TaxID=699041 RepID=UPI001AD7B49A|nr:MarR family transcriptional regulator [Corynebacterium hindlerae]QTH60456.1 MarR family transcriptional regulator [Corynebacterium hindlerae]